MYFVEIFSDIWKFHNLGMGAVLGEFKVSAGH